MTEDTRANPANIEIAVTKEMERAFAFDEPDDVAYEKNRNVFFKTIFDWTVERRRALVRALQTLEDQAADPRRSRIKEFKQMVTNIDRGLP